MNVVNSRGDVLSQFVAVAILGGMFASVHFWGDYVFAKWLMYVCEEGDIVL